MYNPEHVPAELIEMGLNFFRSDYQLTNVESVFKRNDGTCSYYQNNVTGVISGNKLAGIWHSMRDVTELKETEHALHYKTRLDQLVSRISTRFINLSPESIDKKVESALGEFCRLTGSDAGFLSLFSGSGDTFSLTHFWHNHKVQINPSDVIDIPVSQVKRILQKIEKTDSLLLTSSEEWVRLKDLAWIKNQEGFGSVLIRLVKYQEELVGVIGLVSADQHFQME